MPKTNELAAASEGYARWSEETRSPNLTRRTAERFAARILPELQPGMRVLDVGCGPGSITLGLAAPVAPGMALGVDISAPAIEAATTLARERGVSNISFEVGDANKLPHQDASFDAVYSHALLQHLGDPAGAVAEMYRVLKPGGVILISDFDYGGGFIWPTEPALDSAVAAMGQLHDGDGRSPYVGRQLGTLLHETGFERVTPHVTAATDPPANTSATGQFWANYFEAQAVRDYLVALDIASRAEIAAFATAFTRWGAAPGAVWVRLSCEALAHKPA